MTSLSVEVKGCGGLERRHLPSTRGELLLLELLTDHIGWIKSDVLFSRVVWWRRGVEGSPW